MGKDKQMKLIIGYYLILVLFAANILGQTEIKDFYLKDGTIIQGKVIAQDDSIMVVDTQYGSLEIQRSNIIKVEQPKEPQIVTKKPEATTIYLIDGTTIKGVVTVENEDSLGIETDYGLMNIPKSSVKPTENKFIPQKKESKVPNEIDRDTVTSNIYIKEKASKKYWSDEGSTLIGGSGSVSITNTSGNELVLLGIAPNAVFFITSGFGLGFDIGLVYLSDNNSSTTVLTIGPKIMAAFGDRESSTYPYLGFGIDYASSSFTYESSGYYGSNKYTTSTSGSIITFGAGMMMKIGENLGLPLEFDILISNSESEHSTMFAFSVGLAGLLY